MFKALVVLSALLCAVAQAQDLSTYGWSFYDTTNKSLKNNHIRDIQFDKKGRAWVSAANQALYCWEKGKWTQIKKPLPDSMVTGWLNSMAWENDDVLVIGGIPGKLYYLHTPSRYWYSRPLPGKDLQAMQLHIQGKTMLAGTQAGLYQLHEGKWKLLIQGSGDVMGLAVLKDGDVIAGLRNGSYHLNYRGSKGYSVSRCFTPLALYDAVADSTGVLWGAAYNDLQLHRFHRDSVDSFVPPPKDLFYNMNGAWKYCIHKTGRLPDGRIMFVTQFNAGLAVKSKDYWEGYLLPINGEFDGVNNIRVASDSSIWMATWRHGVAVFSPKNHPYHKHENRKNQPLQTLPGQDRRSIPNQQQQIIKLRHD